MHFEPGVPVIGHHFATTRYQWRIVGTNDHMA
jgi:hypothetical protein